MQNYCPHTRVLHNLWPSSSRSPHNSVSSRSPITVSAADPPITVSAADPPVTVSAVDLPHNSVSNALDGSEDDILYEQSEDSDTSDSEELSFINVDSSEAEFLGFPD